MDYKKWYLSKSVWLGVIAISCAVLKAVESGASWESIGLAAFGAAAVALRSVTSLPLGK